MPRFASPGRTTAWFVGVICAAILAVMSLTPAPALASPPASALAAPSPPRLVRVALGPALPIDRLLGAGLDVVEVHGNREALILEWPGDETRIAALGAAANVVDATPGATLAMRTAEDMRAHPARAAKPLWAEGTQVLPPFGSGSFGGYWTLDEIKLKLDQLVASDGNDVVADKIDTVGYSLQGRPIWGLRLGKTAYGQDTRPVVFYNALTHAREPEGMQALFYFVDDLLGKYGSDAFATSLLDQRVIYIVPLVNPDGYQINVNQYVANGTFGFWRKNARDNDLNGIINGNDGVDLNRNFGYQWGLDDVGSSPAFGSETYRGPNAFSESETRAQRDLVIALKPRTGLSFHTYSDLMLYPWGWTTVGAPDSAAFQEWTDAASIGDGYQTGPAPRVLYSVNGEFNDWTYGETVLKPRAYTWTPEVGNPNDFFYPPPSRIVPLAAENLRRCYVVAAIAGAYVRIDRARLSEGTLDIGGSAHVELRARNLGLATAGPGLEATLIPLDPGVSVTGGPVSFPDLTSRQSGDAIAGATFIVTAADTVTPGRILRLEVDFSTPAGMFSRDTVEVPAGRPTVLFSDNATSALANWTGSGWGVASGEAAHPAPFLADSPLGDYSANANSAIATAGTLNLSVGVHAYAFFQCRWDIETAYDDAALEASLDGVTWTQVAGRATSAGVGPSQPAGRPIYSGTRELWADERVDLSSFAGPAAIAARVRFHFVSDGGGQFDGFNFDSLRIVVYDPAAQPSPVAVRGVVPHPIALNLDPPMPNPAGASARFSYELPRDGTARLEILDLAGRRVRLIADQALRADRYVGGWDLRDDAGRAVAPGLYLVRLAAAGRFATRRLVVLR